MMAKITYRLSHAVYSTSIHQDEFESGQLSRSSLNRDTRTENVVALAMRMKIRLREVVNMQQMITCVLFYDQMLIIGLICYTRIQGTLGF